MQEPHGVVLIQFRWHLASALGRALICVHANRPAPAPALRPLLGACRAATCLEPGGRSSLLTPT